MTKGTIPDWMSALIAPICTNNYGVENGLFVVRDENGDLLASADDFSELYKKLPRKVSHSAAATITEEAAKAAALTPFSPLSTPTSDGAMLVDQETGRLYIFLQAKWHYSHLTMALDFFRDLDAKFTVEIEGEHAAEFAHAWLDSHPLLSSQEAAGSASFNLDEGVDTLDVWVDTKGGYTTYIEGGPLVTTEPGRHSIDPELNTQAATMAEATVTFAKKFHSKYGDWENFSDSIPAAVFPNAE